MFQIRKAGSAIMDCRHGLQIEAKPCNGNCYIWLDAGNHHLGAAAAHFRRHVAEGAGGKRIHDVKCPDLENHPFGMDLPDLVQKGIVETR